MRINSYMAAVWPLLMIVALVLIGVVFARRAGAGRARMWVGLALIALIEVVGMVWTSVMPSLVYSGTSIALLSLMYTVLRGVLLIAGIALIASGALAGRAPQNLGYLDPTQPGAPPTPYVPGPYGPPR